jgi:hypothetical protein
MLPKNASFNYNKSSARVNYQRATVDKEPSLNGNYCHTFSSKTGLSSQRSRAAAGAHLFRLTSEKMSRSAMRRNRKRLHQKNKKHENNLVLLQSTKQRKEYGKKYSIKFLMEYVVVFDGGINGETAPCLNSEVTGWCCQRIADGHLEVCHPPSVDKGLIYKDETDHHPRFILLPRRDAIMINTDGRELCRAMCNVAKKKNKLVRGQSKTVFGESKYCCVGSKPIRNATGVDPGQYNLDGVTKDEWDCIVTAVKRSEHAFYCYAGTEAIRHIRDARDLTSWETIKYSDEKDVSDAAIFNGIAFGVNVYLRAHIDNDFTYSVIQVHVDNADYTIEDDVVCYFCFPRLGVAVALKPGDFLLVNALEYHCLSSRCSIDVDIFCVSSYLKTAVVGGNDNGKSLSEREQDCLKAYDESQLKTKRQRRDL